MGARVYGEYCKTWRRKSIFRFIRRTLKHINTHTQFPRRLLDFIDRQTASLEMKMFSISSLKAKERSVHRNCKQSALRDLLNQTTKFVLLDTIPSRIFLETSRSITKMLSKQPTNPSRHLLPQQIFRPAFSFRSSSCVCRFSSFFFLLLLIDSLNV